MMHLELAVYHEDLEHVPVAREPLMLAYNRIHADPLRYLIGSSPMLPEVCCFPSRFRIYKRNVVLVMLGLRVHVEQANRNTGDYRQKQGRIPPKRKQG